MSLAIGYLDSEDTISDLTYIAKGKYPHDKNTDVKGTFDKYYERYI